MDPFGRNNFFLSVRKYVQGTSSFKGAIRKYFPLAAIPVIAYIGYHRKYYATKLNHWNYAYYPLFKGFHKWRAYLFFAVMGKHSLFIDVASRSTNRVQNHVLNSQFAGRHRDGTTTKSARIVVISDTHELHRGVNIPDGDILIHCGDILFANFHKYSLEKSLDKIRDFNQWLGSLPHRYKLIVAGNHDYCFEQIGKEQCIEMLSNGTYLEQDEITLKFDEQRSIKLFCSPSSIPNSDFSTNRAFQYDREEIGPRIWSKIPEDIDILVTHHMPKGFVDADKGCEYLLNMVRNSCTRCRYHVYGHVHGSYGVEFGGTEFENQYRDTVCFVNASTVDSFVCAIHPAVIFDYSFV